jgi:hypothetical protein
MTESTTWLSIAADDLRQIREDIDAKRAKWTDDDVSLRLLWDAAAGLVGLGQELHSEHREAVKIWGQVREPRVVPLAEQQRALLERIGAVWRGDWSGHNYDGRDGQRWIGLALSDHPAHHAELDVMLKRQEEPE